MNRVQENAACLKEIDTLLKDPDLIDAILLNPERGVEVGIASSLPVLIDMSKSLAIIADKITER